MPSVTKPRTQETAMRLQKTKGIHAAPIAIAATWLAASSPIAFAKGFWAGLRGAPN
jgi:hypothetical protein